MALQLREDTAGRGVQDMSAFTLDVAAALASSSVYTATFYPIHRYGDALAACSFMASWATIHMPAYSLTSTAATP